MSQSSDPKKQLFVFGDPRSVPFSELRSLCNGFADWLSAGLRFKLLKKPHKVTFATEGRRLQRIKTESVPKRLLKYFDGLRGKVEPLGFHLNHYASVPSIGPMSIATMQMSERDGKVSFFVTRMALRVGDSIVDDGNFGFLSSLGGDDVLMTSTKAILPAPRSGVHRRMLDTESPKELYTLHTKRMLDNPVEVVDPDGLFDFHERQHELEADDLLKRGVIRPATQGEIMRLRKERG